MELDVIGIAWYRPEDYDRLKAMFEDGETLPDTYDEWLETAKKVTGTLAVSGEIVVKAWIDPTTFPAWCKKHRVSMDVNGRTQYAREYAEARSRANHQPGITRR